MRGSHSRRFATLEISSVHFSVSAFRQFGDGILERASCLTASSGECAVQRLALEVCPVSYDHGGVPAAKEGSPDASKSWGPHSDWWTESGAARSKLRRVGNSSPERGTALPRPMGRHGKRGPLLPRP